MCLYVWRGPFETIRPLCEDQQALWPNPSPCRFLKRAAKSGSLDRSCRYQSKFVHLFMLHLDMESMFRWKSLDHPFMSFIPFFFSFHIIPPSFLASIAKVQEPKPGERHGKYRPKQRGLCPGIQSPKEPRSLRR